MMAMPESRCWCCRLETGVKVIAILNILATAAYAIQTLVSLVGGGNKTGNGIACAVYIVWLIISIFLLVGAVKRDACKCKVWLIGHPILFVLFVIANLILIMNDRKVDESLGSSSKYIAFGVLTAIGIAIVVYVFVVVRKYIKEIENGPPEGMVMMMMPPEYGQAQVIQYGGDPQMTPSYHPSRSGQPDGFDPSAPPPPPQSYTTQQNF